jgi:hypothetical protein
MVEAAEEVLVEIGAARTVAGVVEMAAETAVATEEVIGGHPVAAIVMNAHHRWPILRSAGVEVSAAIVIASVVIGVTVEGIDSDAVEAMGPIAARTLNAPNICD